MYIQNVLVSSRKARKGTMNIMYIWIVTIQAYTVCKYYSEINEWLF